VTTRKNPPVTTSIATLRALFSVRTDNPELVQAQIKALSKQMPLLFFIGLVNTLAVAWTHYGVAPNIFTIGCPVFVAISYAVIGWRWVKTRFWPLNHAEACHLLKLTTIQAPVGTAMSLAWTLVLFQYGDTSAQGHVVFTVGITMISCIFCQMHLRAAALSVIGVTAIAFAVFFLTTGTPVCLAIALSMLLVLAAMVYILLVFSRDFEKMIDFQNELGASHLEISRLANLDSLTELPNRRHFFSTLHELLSRATGGKQRFVVGVVDLDGFKSVNDLYGHTAGDRVLIEAGRRMRNICGDTISFSRLGGDEFGVIVDDEMDDTEIQALGVRICKVLEVPFVLPDGIVEVSGSVGFAVYPQAASTAELLYERADYSLYYAKQHHRGRPVIFSIEHETEIRRCVKLERCLRHADLDSEISLCFQPIVDVERGKTVAFEALARWDSPILGRVAPDIFIRIAERSDLINKLTRMLPRKTLATAKSWPDDIRVSFNLSMRDLGTCEAIGGIAAIIENSGIAPSRIDLEVTETAMTQDFDQANVSLRTLKALGVGISLDDFGTGYSSLSHISSFPIDKIKVDRSFVREVETRASCRAMVKSVIDMSRNLELGCIVEGMETRSGAGAAHLRSAQKSERFTTTSPETRQINADSGSHRQARRSSLTLASARSPRSAGRRCSIAVWLSPLEKGCPFSVKAVPSDHQASKAGDLLVS
jgi:diguanylate cyclase (GGDEF)-like protein